MATNAKIMKWGNSLAMRIPRSSARRLSLRVGSEVEIDDTTSSITIRIPKAKKTKSVSLDELLKGVTPENLNRDNAWLNMKPVGREVW